MTCRRFRKELVMNIVGEQKDKERRRLERHLARCASCREEHELTRRALDGLNARPAPPAPPEVDWERNWRAIEAGIAPARRRSRAGLPAALPRWAYAPLALLVLFGLGIVVGRYVLPQRPDVPGAVSPLALTPAAEKALLSRYFEDVKVVLTDYAHNGIASRPDGLVRTDREIARSLLVQNLLLRRALAEKNPETADLLEDLRLILTEIANLQSRDEFASVSLKSLISDRRILSRIRGQEKI
jgi:hypothetical protein